VNKTTITIGGTFGSSLAMAVSYGTNQHIGWAILHGICSWLYVIYRALGFGA